LCKKAYNRWFGGGLGCGGVGGGCWMVDGGWWRV